MGQDQGELYHPSLRKQKNAIETKPSSTSRFKCQHNTLKNDYILDMNKSSIEG